MEQLDLLNTRINLIKNNIQDIIDKCSNKDEMEDIIYNSLQIKKQEYMSELENAMKELKSLKNKSRLQTDYKKVVSATDTMQYYRLKNKPNSEELMNQVKKKREEAQQDFENMKRIEEDYNLKENQSCDTLPGFIFFYKDIVNNYGICPYIEITDDIFNKRKEWLSNQSDKGELYYSIYDKLIIQTDYNKLQLSKKAMEEELQKLHMNYLNSSQYDMFIKTEDIIKEYNDANIKTKKLKDKFKIIINNVSNLVIETGLNINEYIKNYYGLYIPINIPIKHNIDIVIDANNKFLVSLYNDKISEYVHIIEEIDILKRFINNTITNLKYELYQYLYKATSVKKQTVNQVGKCFKKWSKMTDEEKEERYNSFSEYFVTKYLVNVNIIDKEQSHDMIISLNKLLKENMKRIKYKNIKWNIKKGIIEQISCLKYNSELNEFYITQEKNKDNEKTNEKDNNDNNEKNNNEKNNNENDKENNKDKDNENDNEKNKGKDNIKKVNSESKRHHSAKTKKVSSTRTIISKENEKIINEELVIFILEAKKNKNLNDIKVLKEEFIEKLKIKLLLKRITLNDKIHIFKIFDDIYTVIINNNCNS